MIRVLAASGVCFLAGCALVVVIVGVQGSCYLYKFGYFGHGFAVMFLSVAAGMMTAFQAISTLIKIADHDSGRAA